MGEAKATRMEPKAKGRRGSDPSRKPHVTASGIDSDSRVCASVPYRGKASRVAAIVLSSRRDGESGLGNLGSWRPAKAERRRHGSDRGVRRAVRTGALGRTTPRANLANPPKRIGRRETQGSPVSWSRVQARESRARRKPRRDTGSSRGMGARSRGSGKQKSVVRIVLVSRGKSQDELQGGQLARSKSSLR